MTELQTSNCVETLMNNSIVGHHISSSYHDIEYAFARVRFPDVMAAIDAKLFGRWCAAARLEVKLFYFIGLFITTND